MNLTSSLASFVGWVLCIAHGGHHDIMVVKGRCAIALRCTDCLRETKGWEW